MESDNKTTDFHWIIAFGNIGLNMRTEHSLYAIAPLVCTAALFMRL